MSNKRVYYPLQGTKGRYRSETVNYISVAYGPDYDYILSGVEIGESGAVNIFETSGELLEFINSLPNRSWLISWDLNYLPTLLSDLLGVYNLRGVVTDQLTGVDLVQELDNGKERIIYLVSLFPFYLTGINSALHVTGAQVDKIDQRVKDDNPARYLLTLLDAVRFLWVKLRDGLKTLFNVHPSKLPGATALKSWRTYITDPLFSKGRPINNLCYDAIPPAALYWKTGIHDNVYLYDINAAYPAIMRGLKFPVHLTGFVDRGPPSNYWIALVNCSYKSRVNISPFWHRLNDGTIVRPKIAERVNVVITYIDALLYEQTGDFKIHNFIEGVYWYKSETRDLFSRWVDDTEDFIINNPDFKPAVKVVTRALHSKFRPSRDRIPLADLKIVSPDEVIAAGDRVRDIFPLPDGRLSAMIYRETDEVFKPYTFPHFDALIMAAARYDVYTNQDENTIYIDTDCIMSVKPRSDLIMGGKFGQWKLTNKGRAHIAGLRLYTIDYRPKAAGVNPVDRDQLTRAIVDTSLSDNTETEIKKVERLGFNNLVIGVKVGARVVSHRVRHSKMPTVYIKEGNAYITNSPPRKQNLTKFKRVMSADKKGRVKNENARLQEQAQSVIKKIASPPDTKG